MYNRIIALLCVAFAGLLAYVNREAFVAFSQSGFSEITPLLQNVEVLAGLFILSIGIHFAFAAPTGVRELPEADVDETATQDSDALKDVSSEEKTIAAAKAQPTGEEALYVLSVLQSKGRLIDFVMDDIAQYSDQQVGQVARVVHSGVREALNEFTNFNPIHSGQEGETIAVETDFDATVCRVVGSGTLQPPLSGKVVHKGWRATELALPKRLPSLVEQQHVVQPMEIEVV